ncbi:MAG: phage integrase SAM-like domain-containing protein [Cyclobacteriaceae bacterium]
MKSLIGHEFSPLTFERYTTSKKHTHDFMKWKYKIDDIDIKKLNYEFIHSYEFWLKSVRKCDHNTSIKYLSNFKKIVNICLKNGWLDRDPFVGFKMTKREVERPFLDRRRAHTNYRKEIYHTTYEPGARHLYLLLLYWTCVR